MERGLSPLAAIGLGQMLAAAAMLTRLTAKRPTRMLLEAAGDGPLGRVRAEADTLGHLRGLVENPLAAGSSDSTRALELGTGLLRVVRQSDKRVHESNYESQVLLVAGGVARNVANFLDRSEQIRSAVLLGVHASADGIDAGGGLIVQAMPGASPPIISELEQRLATLPGTSQLLQDGDSLGLMETVLEGLDPEPLHEAPLVLSCDCDRERFRSHILSLSEQEPDLVDETEDTLIECSFCGAEYEFAPDELALAVN